MALSAASLGSVADPDGMGGLSVKIRYNTAVYFWTELGPVAGNERDSPRKIPDARLQVKSSQVVTLHTNTK